MGLLGWLRRQGGHEHGGHEHGGHEHGNDGHGHGHHGQPGHIVHEHEFDAPRRYDVVSAVSFLGLHRQVFRRLARLAAPEPGCTVLDVGCGTGALTWPVAELVGRGGHVVGIDPAAAMLDHARSANRRGRGAWPDFREGRAEALDLPDGSVDLVVSSLAFHHLPDQASAAAEIARVLRPGGRVMIAEFAPFGGPVTRRIARLLLGHAMANDHGPEVARDLAAAGLCVLGTHRAALVFGCVLAIKPGLG